MNVLIGCERSGVVRDAFTRHGHNAWSCDLMPTLSPGQHITADIAEVAMWDYWDLMIAHPPCQYVSYAGARWWKRPGWNDEQQKALTLFAILLNAPAARIALENPRGLPLKLIRAADDVIEPYEFGHHVSKRTYLWLKNLPPLMKTHIDLDYSLGWTGGNKGFARSITFSGIAEAMASQWGTR